MLGIYGHCAVHEGSVTPGIRLYDDHLRGPVTLTPNAERLAVELSLPVFTT